MNCLGSTLGMWMMRIDLHLPAWRVFEILCRLISRDSMRLKAYSRIQIYVHFDMTIILDDLKDVLTYDSCEDLARTSNVDRGRWSLAVHTYVLLYVTEEQEMHSRTAKQCIAIRPCS